MRSTSGDVRSNPRAGAVLGSAYTAVEGVIGVDLPDDKIKTVVDGIKAKVSVDDVKDKVGGLLGKLKN